MQIIQHEVRMINTAYLSINEAYQRMLSEAHVQNIVDNFKMSEVNNVKVSYRDGRYYVYDGQHTIAALKMMNSGEDLEVSCDIRYDMTEEDEAFSFGNQGAIKRSVPVNNRIRAFVEAHEPSMILLIDELEKMGIDLAYNGVKGIPADTKNVIRATGIVMGVYKNQGLDDLLFTLWLIKNAWHGDPKSYQARMITGMALFVKTYGKEIEPVIAVKKFGAYSIDEVIRQAGKFTNTSRVAMARELHTLYNKNLNRGGHRLDLRIENLK